MGRPTTYSENTAKAICLRLMDGDSLRKICADENMPARSTVHLWLLEHDGFSDQYTRARDAQADTLFDESLDIADDGTNDWVADKEEEDGFRYNGDAVQRSRLRIDTRKWMAGKLKPKVYGDRQAVDVSHSLTEEAKAWLGIS